MADLSGGLLGSYDDLAGLPCTSALGTQNTVKLVGWLKTPICANGVSANGRFVNLGPVVFDTQTNLMWETKKNNARGLHDVGNTYTWCEAIGNSAVNTLCAGNAASWIGNVNAEGGTGFAGFTNWRVPTKDELFAIVDKSSWACGYGTPCIDPIFGPTQILFRPTHPIRAGQVSSYWASTDGGLDAPDVAWAVSFWGGGSKGVDLAVRAVRSGP